MGYYRPTPFEVATGWPHGVAPFDGTLERSADAPLDALSDLCREGLERGPCYVAFSGGRDSSAVLAVAVAVARREGLPLPVPVTTFYPDLPEADETEWQEAVVRHLGLSEWARLEAHDENDLLGPAAQESLRARGVLWPPAVHTKVNLLRSLSDGTLLTGEGGDEVFGNRRATPFTHLKRGTSVRRRRAYQQAGKALLPIAVRRELLTAGWRKAVLQPWLRPEVAERHYRLLADDESSEPLRWDQSLLWVSHRRASIVLRQNYEALAADHHISLCLPLLSEKFLRAYATAGGRWGFPGRTEAMRRLFGELLPAPVLGRSSKASFNRAFFGPATRAFASTWDGTGADPELVDAERLRQEWLSEFPAAISGPSLQAAWSACNQKGPGA